jgi:N-acetylmuramoyl-L-alanine amidase
MHIDRFPTPNFDPGREGHAPRGIVVHTNVGSYRSTIGWFADPASGVSAHYLVALDGSVAQFVEESDTARHAGRVDSPTTALVTPDNPNLYTIGVEFEDGGDPETVDRPEAQYAAGTDLLRSASERWNIPVDRDHVVGHREIYAPKTCPGNLDIDRLIAGALAGA